MYLYDILTTYDVRVSLNEKKIMATDLHELKFLRCEDIHLIDLKLS